MLKNQIDLLLKEAETAYLKSLDIIKEFIGRHHERDPRRHHKHHHHPHDENNGSILFVFQFNNTQILQPMSVKKLIGAFSGSLVFKNAEQEVQPISAVTGLAVSGSDDSNSPVASDLTAGTFSGTATKAGTITVTATATNDAGNQVTGSVDIEFHADTTVTEIDVNVD